MAGTDVASALTRIDRVPLSSTVGFLLAVVAMAGCRSAEEAASTTEATEATMSITLTSPDFDDGGTIPTELTCDGDDRSPTLRWEGVPEDTTELTLLVEDPDAPGGTFVHWVLWGLDPESGELPGGAVPASAVEGRNDFGRVGWAGPCPPRGRGEHRYIFTLFALSDPLPLEAGASADDLREAVQDSLVAQGRLTGRYGRT